MDLPFADRLSDRRVIMYLLLGLFLLICLIYVACYFLTSDRVPRNTTVADVAIGGLTPEQAQNQLDRSLGGRSGSRIVVSASGQRGALDPARSGLRLDTRASVAQAGAGRSWSPTRMWNYLVGGGHYNALVDVDSKKLHTAVESFAKKVNQPAKEGRITFRGSEPVAHYPKDGTKVDEDAATDQLQSAFLRNNAVVPLKVRQVEPEVTKQDVSNAMDHFANPAMSGPVMFELGGEDVVLRPETYSDALAIKPEHGKLAPVLHHKRLLAELRPRMQGISAAPKNATVKLVNGNPRVVPGKKGATFDAQQVTHQFLSKVVQHGQNRTMELRKVVAQPAFSTADARGLKIKERVSQFTTYFPYEAYRNINQGRAAELMDGSVIKPGQTFSLNDTVGERTKANGFTKGYIIDNGVYQEDFGGGVSQVATTTFNAMFFAGLQDVEHKTHSFYIDRYPIGREATVAWPYVDLKFKNDTPYGVLIHSWVVPGTYSRYGQMHVEMWSTKYWDIKTDHGPRYKLTKPKTRHMHGKNCVPNDGYGGFDINVHRYFYRHGSDTLDHKQTFHTHYLPSDNVVCEKRKSS